MCPVRFLDRDPMLDVPGTADVPLTASDRARGLKACFWHFRPVFAAIGE